MSQDKTQRLESQKKDIEYKLAKVLATANRTEASIIELKRQNDKAIRIQKNAKLIEIGKIICKELKVKPEEVDLDNFCDFLNHTWISFNSTGIPLTKNPGHFYNDYNNVWKMFSDQNKRKCFIEKKK